MGSRPHAVEARRDLDPDQGAVALPHRAVEPEIRAGGGDLRRADADPGIGHLDRAKGREMVSGLIAGFFANGPYQLIFLFAIGSLIPFHNPAMVLNAWQSARAAAFSTPRTRRS